MPSRAKQNCNPSGGMFDYLVLQLFMSVVKNMI